MSGEQRTTACGGIGESHPDSIRPRARSPVRGPARLALGAFNNPKGRLRSLGLIDYPQARVGHRPRRVVSRNAGRRSVRWARRASNGPATTKGASSMADSQALPEPTRHPRATTWKGGRSVASNGYVLVRVGKDHHLADVRGYAYEHRLVAERMLGRRLRDGEIPHHISGVKTDNRPENIEVVESAVAHRVRHRSQHSRLQMPHEPNVVVACECGCGEAFYKYDKHGRPRRFVSGHNPLDASTQRAILDQLADGVRLTRGKIAAGIGLPLRAAASALSRLKRKGLVRQFARGIWEKSCDGVRAFPTEAR